MNDAKREAEAVRVAEICAKFKAHGIGALSIADREYAVGVFSRRVARIRKKIAKHLNVTDDDRSMLEAAAHAIEALGLRHE